MGKQEPSIWEKIWPYCDFEMALLELEIAQLSKSGLIEQMKGSFVEDSPGYGAFRIYARRYGSKELCEALDIPHNPPD